MTSTSSVQDAAILAALETNLWGLWSRFGRGEGCQLHDEAGATWFDTPIPTPPYNAVLRFIAEDRVEERIDALFEHYRRREVPFVWFLHPSAQPGDLEARLRARGLEEAETCPGMAMSLADLPAEPDAPDGVEVEEVTSEQDVTDFLELVSWRWEVAPGAIPLLPSVTRAFELGQPGSTIRCWVARQQGVATAKILLHLDAGAAGIYGVATRPEARGQGLARILTLRALHAARRDGHRLAVLHSTPMAVSLYEQIGFRAYGPFKIFAPPNVLHV